MRALIKLISVLLLLASLTLLTVTWLALSDTPEVAREVRLSHHDIARAKQIFKRNDPRRLPPGTRRSIEISLADLNLAGSYWMKRLTGGHADLTTADKRLILRASMALPRLPLRNIVNLEATVAADQGRASLQRLRIGELALPEPLANWVAAHAIGLVSDRAQVAAAAASIEQLRIFPDRIQLSYRWHPTLIENARQSLLTGVDRDALRHYHDHLVALQQQGIGTSGSLVPLLKAMFAAAAERSASADPIVENTALLTVLGTWAGRQDIGRLVPGELQRPGPFRLKLHRRRDLAQHFLSSAALAARGDSTLSDAVGLFKELADSDRGSGFSFVDIAADRAGTRFGELATRATEDALGLQAYLTRAPAEDDLMPDTAGLPEQMDAATFRQRFGGVGSPAYTRTMDEIERRIDSRALYQPNALR